MNYEYTSRRHRRWLAIESVTFGLAYGACLCWVSTCLLASFRPDDLSAAYWSVLPGLRTDTLGIVAFLASAIFLSSSEFLRLRRKWIGTIPSAGMAFGESINAAALAVSETAGFLSTAVIVYISVNVITHPATLGEQATHLVSWPTESTLRLIALVICIGSITLTRILRVERRLAEKTAGSPAEKKNYQY